jgi:hypothetical protein
MMKTVSWLIRLRRLFCRHNESVTHFENQRMSLLCMTCGHESPGWDVGRAV